MNMGVGTVIREEEYLHTSYSPECGFERGVLVERNVGTESHSWLQTALGAYFFRKRKHWDVTVYTGLRIKVHTSRYMVPDLCVVQGPRPKERVLTTPPILVIEILSPEDRPIRVNKTVQDWREFGVPYVCVIDPETFENELHDESGRRALADGVLRIPGTPIAVPIRLLDEE